MGSICDLSFAVGRYWLDSIKAFKLLNNESQLLYFTEQGFRLFDTYHKNIKTKVDFPDLGASCYSDFTLSPNTKFLALACNSRIDGGNFIHGSFIRLYNLETGEASSDLFISIDHQESWIIEFSEDGRQLRASSNSTNYLFDFEE